jgi:hypothetical protein
MILLSQQQDPNTWQLESSQANFQKIFIMCARSGIKYVAIFNLFKKKGSTIPIWTSSGSVLNFYF